MQRFHALLGLIGVGVILACWLLFQTPGTLADVLWNPLQALLGTQRQINSTLLEVSEAEPVRAAGRRLLQPFGVVRLVRIYEPPDSDPSKKR